MKKILLFFMKIFVYSLRIFPIKKNKIFFSSFGGRKYSDNPRYIMERMIELNMNYKYIFVLRTKKNLQLPKNVIIVKYFSIRYFYEMTTSKIWIDNTRKFSLTYKRKGQYYIQTWHGSLAIKKIEGDVPTLSPKYIDFAKKDSKNIDLLLTNSKWGENMLKRCFWYNGPIAITGSPRVDIFFKNNDNLFLKKKIGIKQDSLVVLYAPTFRDNNDFSVYDLDYEHIGIELEKKYNKKIVFIVKLHPNLSNININLPSYVMNLSNYEDLNELLLISDILITDYSSCSFDFMVTNKPIFLFVKDEKSYINERNFNFKINDLPFLSARDNNQLIKLIRNFDEFSYKKGVEKFISDLHILEDGKACDRVIEFIKNV